MFPKKWKINSGGQIPCEGLSAFVESDRRELVIPTIAEFHKKNIASGICMNNFLSSCSEKPINGRTCLWLGRKLSRKVGIYR